MRTDKGRDRRKYVRIPFGYIVRYRKYTPGRKTFLFKAKAKNLSLGGILLETKKEYPVSSVLEIELNVPVTAEQNVYAEVIGKVVRSTVIEPKKAYDTAIQFVSIPAKHRKGIKRLISVFSNA